MLVPTTFTEWLVSVPKSAVFGLPIATRAIASSELTIRLLPSGISSVSVFGAWL